MTYYLNFAGLFENRKIMKKRVAGPLFTICQVTIISYNCSMVALK